MMGEIQLCNQVHVIKGPCGLASGHAGPHAWASPEAQATPGAARAISAQLAHELSVQPPARRIDLNPFRLSAELAELLDFRAEAETEEERAAAEKALTEYVRREISKTDDIRAYWLHLDMLIGAAKDEAERQKSRAQALTGRQRLLKQCVCECMRLLGLKRVDGRTGSILRKGNGGVAPLSIANPEWLPENLVDVTVTMSMSTWKAIQDAMGHMLALPAKWSAEPSHARIRQALEREEGVPGARIEDRGQHVELR